MKIGLEKGPGISIVKTSRRYVLFFLVILLAMQTRATHAYGEGHVTIHEKNAPLIKILKEIRQQTGMGYGGQALNMNSGVPVTLSVKDAPLAEVLDRIFQPQPFTYEIVGQIIVVKPKGPADRAETGGSGKPEKPVRIRGIVYNESGQPLSGANVTIMETQKGTITNAKGEFDLGAVTQGNTILISFIGYAPQKIRVTADANPRIYMAVAKNELDKVVIQAYGTTTERLNTGNIATVTAAQIERQPAMNPLTALEGQVPGVVVTQTSGYASAPFKIEIRGRSTIDPSIPSEPLYIIDGVPLTILESGNAGAYSSGSVGVTQNGFLGPATGQSPFFSINPGDIESMTVLKDADATAIYGSRGANGVIIITTKKGKAGKTRLDVNAYQGENAVTQHFSMMNTRQYLTMRREALKNDNIAPTISNAYDLLTYDTTRYTDWQKALWGNRGHTTDVQTALSGGDQQTTFRLSGAYHRETSILTASGADQRGSVQFNLTHKSQDQRLTLSFTNMYTYSESNIAYSPGSATIAPDAPAFFTAPRQLNWNGWGLQANLLQSYAGPLLNTYDAKTGLLNSEVNLKYDIVKGLSVKTQVGYSTIHNTQAGATPIAAQNPMNSPYGSATFGNNNVSNAIVEPQIVFDQRVSKGKLEALAGGSYQALSTTGNSITGTGYDNDNLLGSIGNAGEKNAFDVYLQYHYVAGFGRINYNWEDKYIINVSGRRDGSSRFGPGKQFGNFGAVGVAWIFTQENWFKDHLQLLSFGKLRGSYGITGMDNIGDYQYLSRWSSQGTFPYNGTPSFSPLYLSNPDLQWQTNKKLEGAITLGFLKDRFTIEAVLYRNRCGNQLTDYLLPYLTGFSSVTENLPALVQNSGWEMTIRAKLIDKPKFSWTANFNLGVNRNKLLAFPNLAKSPYASYYVVGQSLNIKKYLHYTGVDPLTGQYTFQDRDHNGSINPIPQPGQSNDLYNRDMSIKFDGGFGTGLRYRSWQLDLFFRFRKQEVPASLSQSPGEPDNNQSTLLLNRWQKPGDHARFARVTTQPQLTDQFFYEFSDAVLSDGSFIRLQNVSLTYDFPVAWAKKFGMQGCRLYARGQNVFLLTKYEGIDPDSPSFGLLPPDKIFVGGIQFTF